MGKHNRLLVNTAEAADALGVSVRHIKNLIHEADSCKKSRWRWGRELIRQIRSGLIYKDLLPNWFRRPFKAGDPTCNQCRFWSDGCSMGFPDPEIEGPRFARDCSVFDAVTPPATSAPCCVSTQGDQQSPAG